MKEDKFLIGIVVGIVLLVIVAIAVVLLRLPENEEYMADDTPAGVVHNYYLAIQRKDYKKAYDYLSDELESKPDLDKFARDIGNLGGETQTALQLGEIRLEEDLAQVDVSITTYQPGGFLESNTYTNKGTAFLETADNGNGWRLTSFPYPYWGYDWDQAKD